MKDFTKCAVSFALLFLFAITTNAQNNPVVSYEFNPDFSPKDSSYYTYNAQNKLTEKSTVAYNANTRKWSNATKETHLVDGQGNTISSLTLKWENNMWVESFKITNTISNNQLTTSLSETKTPSGWVKFQENEYMYTQGGGIDSIYTYKFDNAGLKEKSSRTKYRYATNGVLAEKETERWKSSSETWDVTAKWVYLYDFKERIIKEEEDNFIGGKWFHIHHFKYTYDSDDKLRIKEHRNSATNSSISSEGYKYAGEETFLSVNSINKPETSKVYPNPFSDYATLIWDYEGTYSISITDITGRVVQTFESLNTKEIRINGTELKQGIYFYTLQNTNTSHRAIGKFILTK